jgi:hypothetical protein
VPHHERKNCLDLETRHKDAVAAVAKAQEAKDKKNQTLLTTIGGVRKAVVGDDDHS